MSENEKSHPAAESAEKSYYGMTLQMAKAEAERCLHCGRPRCVKGCPVHISIPEFIADIAAGNPKAAAEKLKTQTALPAVCGRVCPHEKQCEGSCVVGIKGRPVAIGSLERFAADFVRENKLESLPEIQPATGKKVAIIGCGPAGITAAAELARYGHNVEIFEGLPYPGGVLMYGIPEFRLPKEIVLHEVDSLKKMGVKIHLNSHIGRAQAFDELLKGGGFDAVFVGSGAGIPIYLGIEGEDATGVYNANDYLTRFNMRKLKGVIASAKEPITGKHVISIGGGNVAMDSSRAALRLGAKSTLVYRRAKEQMPARMEEIDHAERDGVEMVLLTAPLKILTDAEGKVRAVLCRKMQLGEPDESGRRSPVEIPGSDFEIPCDVVVIAIGNKPNPPESYRGLNTTPKGTLAVDPQTFQTSMDGVFAGGDVVSGALTVINAMGQAKSAAAAIDKFLRGRPLKTEAEPAAGAK